MQKMLVMSFVLIGSWIVGAEDMPKLSWMGDEKARRATTNVVMKILREDKSLSYAGGTRSVASACQTGFTGLTGLVDGGSATLTQRTQRAQRNAKSKESAAVLGLTATPDKNNNAVYSVYAEELFKEEMVKLPIELTEYTDNWESAVVAANAKRAALAKIAAAECAEKAGAYVRPIVLFQATNVNGTVPVAKLKAYLVDTLKIPESGIKIATGDQKELDDVDVTDPKCAVNYVITVEALKEGWDCPFAYVFCSLANVGSSKDTIQLLGRVMRMPYAKRRKSRELNRAYAFVMSSSFGAAAAELTEGLKTKGFSGPEAQQSIQVQTTEQTLGPLFEVADDVVPVARAQLDSLSIPDDSGIRISDLANGDGEIHLTGTENEQAIEEVAKQLVQQGVPEIAQTLKAKYIHKKAQAEICLRDDSQAEGWQERWSADCNGAGVTEFARTPAFKMLGSA